MQNTDVQVRRYLFAFWRPHGLRGVRSAHRRGCRVWHTAWHAVSSLTMVLQYIQGKTLHMNAVDKFCHSRAPGCYMRYCVPLAVPSDVTEGHSWSISTSDLHSICMK